MRRLSPPHTAVVAETVAVLLPGYPELDPAARARVRADVTAFVVSQVEALPSFLRLPYRLAMTAFDLLPVLRHGRVFRRLGARGRDAHLAAWDHSRLAPFRNYVKLQRSCALLAYYDHPEVLQALRSTEAAAMSAMRSAAS